ncbi:hypothetical protein FMUND_360 [Fusarium mundagurra]|uniref:Uncharacterized protein n=1 Tax=Fusarium mundagurra TaxID=1567541 RepID=A0A8H5Z8V2_9HYPO|nr:hypothetical protein FMUND_360 [Fusarium mundagurra]
MAAEPPDLSRQRPRSILSLAKRARNEFRSLLDIKTRIAARRDPHVSPDRVGKHHSTNDLNIPRTKGASQRPIGAPPPNKKDFRGASFGETFEEQRRGMLAFQDPFVMLGAEDISTPTSNLGWLPVDEHKSSPGSIAKILFKIRKSTIRLPDSKTAPEYQDTTPYLRSPTTPRDSPIRCPNDTSRAVNLLSLPVEESWSGNSATRDPRLDGLVPSFCATETNSSQTNLSETSMAGLGSSATSMAEETSLGASTTDDTDGASDVTDYTDLSLIENFETSLVRPNVVLLSALMSIKDEVVSRIVRRVQLTTSGQGARQHISGKASAQFVSQNSETNSSNNSSQRYVPNARKRFLDTDEGYEAGDGDDGKERRTREDLPLALLPSHRTQKFACPFYKRYPEIFFEDERELIEHTRAEQRCDNQSAPAEEEIIYITQNQERVLRKRQRNIPEEERWVLVFQAVFPDIPTDHIPSPYYKLDPGDLVPDAATLAEFRAFAVQELPSRIINDVNNYLRFLPGVTIGLKGIIKSQGQPWE